MDGMIAIQTDAAVDVYESMCDAMARIGGPELRDGYLVVALFARRQCPRGLP